ncbi:MAG: hypothetical protein LBV07_00045 [Syntrophobacterales bacterium]|nr:hypothetical protein [Syntrophobacterales bacterium]
MEKHPFHKKIGSELQKIKELKSNYCVILDEACDDNRKEKRKQISLFVDKKNRKNNLCKVDAIIIKQNDNAVKIIIEIDESNRQNNF